MSLQGQLVAAIQQLELAQKSADGDYFEHSQVDARLRELRAAPCRGNAQAETAPVADAFGGLILIQISRSALKIDPPYFSIK
jgi:hypothetical protein